MLTTKTRAALATAAALFTVTTATVPAAHAQLAPILMKQAAKNRVCNDLKGIMEVNVSEAVGAMQAGNEAAAAQSDKNATKATQDARAAGCGWAQP
jgi:hypothetical protein